MATVNRTPTALVAPHSEAARAGARAAPPHLLRCLVVSLSAERRRLIRVAAEAQAWDAILCKDAGEFLRVAFKRSVPLLIVDLPEENTPEYWELRQAAHHAHQAGQSLLFVSGTMVEPGEEMWARGLGAWAYVNDLCGQRGFEFVLSEARIAVARRASLVTTTPFEDAGTSKGLQEGGW